MATAKKAKTTKKIKKEGKVYSPQMPLDAMDKEESGYNNAWKNIEPAFDKNNVAVCIVSSDEYAPFAAVVVQSIICNATPKNNYDIVVLTDDMFLRNRWRIERLADGRENVSVRIRDIIDIVKGFTFYTWAHFTSKTYYRLLTTDLFAAYDKVLYLDSDVAVNHDIAELYATELGNYLLAAAYDTHVVSYCTKKPPLEQREYNITTLKLKKPEKYFQTGVSLFNVRAFRENYEPGYLIHQAASRKLRWLDQDLINLLCQGKIKRLPNVWNVMIANLADHIDEYYLPEDMRKEYFEARRNPYIVHYVGRAIPCYTTTPDLYEYFWKYARLTPFYEVLIQRMAMDYADKSAAKIISMLPPGSLADQQGQYAALCAQHDQMYAVYQNTLIMRLRRGLKSVLKWFLPAGSKRRAWAVWAYKKYTGWD